MQSPNSLIQRICHRLLEAAPQLNQMDAKVGDGETGSNLSRGVRAILDHITKGTTESNLREIGVILNNSGCGTLGTLWSFLLIKCDKAANLTEALDLLESGFEKHSGAKIGDKTMGDALLPWIYSLREGKIPVEASKISLSHTEATANFPGKVGRGKYSGSVSIGTVDPGAYATWIVLDEVSKEL